MVDVHGFVILYYLRYDDERGLRYCLSLEERQCESLIHGISKDRIPALFLYVSTRYEKQNAASGSLPNKKADVCAMNDIHFGRMIDAELRKQRYSVTWFAKEMGSDRSNMYKLLERQHLNSDFILRASRLLNHDFFGEASKIFKESTTD